MVVAPWLGGVHVADVAVVGAGVVGAAVAYALVQAGAQVEVLEAGAISGGTSAATFAVDISRIKTPRTLFDLSVASARAHEALERELGVSWRHPAASLEWDGSPEDHRHLQARVERLQAWGYPVEWVSAQRARELEPALDVAVADGDGVAFYREGAWYEPPAFAAALLDRARAAGARVHTHDAVVAMATARGRISRLTTAAGRRVTADLVVVCAGPQAAELAALAGAALPVRLVPGLVVATTPAATGLRTIVSAADLNLRPDRDDRVVLHSWIVDAELGTSWARSDVAGLAGRLLTRARKVLPALVSAEVQTAKVGVRPVPVDGLPLVGFLPETENLYAVVAHSAVHLAPILGHLAARELTGGADGRLEPFRPVRLLAGVHGREALDESTRTMLARVTR